MADTAAPLTRAISAPRFAGPPCPDRFNIARATVGRFARETPDKDGLLVVTGAGADAPVIRWTYREIETAVLGIAALLRARGLGPGDRIAVRLGNTPAYAFTVFGGFAIGAVPVPLSDQLTDGEVAGLVADCGARALVIADGPPEAAGTSAAMSPAAILRITLEEIEAAMAAGAAGAGADYADTRSDDPAFLVYTSGTTARPKGVLHAHRSAWGRRPMIEGWYGLTAADRLMHAGSFNWTFTLGTGLTDPWMSGATAIVMTGDKSPEVWPGLLKRTGATLFAAVPGLVRQILKYGDGDVLADLPALRHGLIAGDTPPPGLFEDWERATGTPLFEALGMSEISTYVSFAPGIPRKPGAVGRPQPGRAVAILPDVPAGTPGADEPLAPGEIGLLAVHRSDPGLMLGYWNRPEEEAEVYRGDWFAGGDLAHMDRDGTVFHHGRGNDIMKPGGYRVAPQEVEAVLASHAGVAEAACVDVEVKPGVSVVAAYIVARDPAAPPGEQDLFEHAAAHLAVYKRPRIIRFVGSLPKTPNGKLTRAALRTLT